MGALSEVFLGQVDCKSLKKDLAPSQNYLIIIYVQSIESNQLAAREATLAAREVIHSDLESTFQLSDKFPLSRAA